MELGNLQQAFHMASLNKAGNAAVQQLNLTVQPLYCTDSQFYSPSKLRLLQPDLQTWAERWPAVSFPACQLTPQLSPVDTAPSPMKPLPSVFPLPPLCLINSLALSKAQLMPLSRP